MSRVRLASRNYVSSIVYAAMTLVTGFVATPWILRWLGEERFGAFRVTSDWCGYLSLLEFGIGGALLPLLAHAVVKQEREKVYDLLAASIRVYLILVSVMVLAGLL